MDKLTVPVFLLLLAFSAPLAAQETQGGEANKEAGDSIVVEGVTVARQVEVGDAELGLNGTGMRTAFWRNYYLGALYLPGPSSDPAEIIISDTPSRIALHFIRDVSLSRMKSALEDGFENNTPQEEMEELSDEIEQFKDMFSPPTEGDRIDIDYHPDQGTTVTINGEEKGVIEGVDFKRAVMRIFLGEDPADKNLRDGMLDQG